MASQSRLSHLTLFSVLMCEMRELNYMITKFISGSDILSFICINTDSYIKDSGSENFMYTSYKVSLMLETFFVINKT